MLVIPSDWLRLPRRRVDTGLEGEQTLRPGAVRGRPDRFGRTIRTARAM